MSIAVTLAGRTRLLVERAEYAPEIALGIASEPIRAAVLDALDRGETHYTDRPGILPLRQKIAASLAARFIVTANAKNDIIVTCGVTEARFVAVQQLLNPGDNLAAPASSDRLFGAALLRRVEIVTHPHGETSLLYLTSSTPEADLRSSLAAASASTLVLFEVDEFTSCFHPAQLPTFEGRTVTIGNLGDESWRVGYLASPGSFSPALRDFKQALTICSTNISQWAALAFSEPDAKDQA